MPISSHDLKILWAKSGGLCAFPGCKQELISKTSDDIIGHACHIIAQKSDGPRGNTNDIIDDIDAEANLILLCPTHHRIIDTEFNLYTVEKLIDMKRQHEIYIYDRLHTGPLYKLNFTQPYYLNLPRLAIIAAYNGIELNFDFMERFNCLHAVGYQLNQVMLEIRKIIRNMTINAVQLNTDFSKLQIGQTVEFTGKFRTKGMPSPDETCRKEYNLKGDLKYDPYLYISQNEQKFILTLDPRWMTTTTSFIQFANGSVNIAGLAIIKHISKNEIIASPYVLGIPKSPLDELFNTSKAPRTIDIP